MHDMGTAAVDGIAGKTHTVGRDRVTMHWEFKNPRCVVRVVLAENIARRVSSTPRYGYKKFCHNKCESLHFTGMCINVSIECTQITIVIADMISFLGSDIFCAKTG